MRIEHILVVEDDPLMRQFLEEALKRKEYRVTTARNGKEGLSQLRKNSCDLVLTDVSMPEMNGIDFLKKIKELYPSTLVIVMTAFGSIENAVECMQQGAFTYLPKPFTPDSLEILLQKAAEQQALLQENTFLRREIEGTRLGTKIIAESPTMRAILDKAITIAKSQASVLIEGESGTGKEVIAGAIHAYSNRSSHPYIRVNCPAIPETLMESEFFGHEKGSFTGATSKKPGRFELADKGTLLLDEVTEIPLQLQPKLLRVIQEREFERVGGIKPLSVDVRLISTTNRDLKEAIDAKIFREDLYYRLNVVPLHLPPLRERPEDILPLADHFLQKHSLANGKKTKFLSAPAKKELLNYPWPGNIRELGNVIERAVVLSTSKEISCEDLYLQ